MAITELPESGGTASASGIQNLKSDPNHAVRRRRGSNGFEAINSEDVCGTGAGLETVNERSKSIGDGSGRTDGGSVANGGEESKVTEATTPYKYAYRASAPAHRRIKESPLSSDAIFRQSHAGLFNLCVVVLIAVNSRLIIENLMKFQLLPLTAFLVEKMAQQRRMTERAVVILHITITPAAILYPVLVILKCDFAFLSGVILMLVACIVRMKLVSYAHANHDMRQLVKSIDKVETSDVDCYYDVSFKSLA